MGNINEFIKKYDFKKNNNNKFLLSLSKKIEKLEDNELNLFLNDLLLNNDILKEVLLSYVINNKIDLNKLPSNFKTNSVINIFNTFCEINNISFIYNEYEYDSYHDTNLYKIYEKDFYKYKIKSQEQIIQLIKNARCGDKNAKDEIILSNLRLVVSRVKMYNKNQSNFEFLDAVQEGNLGLIIAVDKYDETLGCKFSTFATWYIDNKIRRYINKVSRKDMFTYTMYRDINKYRRMQENYYTLTGRFPTNVEIKNKLHFNDEYIKLLKTYEDNMVLSLDKKFSDEQEIDFYDLISSNENLEDEAISNVSLEEIYKIIEKIEFTPKQKEVAIMFFKSNGNINLSEISNKYNISRQAASLLLIRVLKKLRNNEEIKKINNDNYKSEKKLYESDILKKIL